MRHHTIQVFIKQIFFFKNQMAYSDLWFQV